MGTRVDGDVSLRTQQGVERGDAVGGRRWAEGVLEEFDCGNKDGRAASIHFCVLRTACCIPPAPQNPTPILAPSWKRCSRDWSYSSGVFMCSIIRGTSFGREANRFK